ncbi:hypothetical protein I553_0939 [Mycobacterium xenopi 4042]|uniref:Uncharacterized protein n=1 Tax=Mycobacterium xenopi 4042 TaxID=1299334 RepID=X7ZBK2_MYCXE|nr:hypothetical protein I553_0939 [Mycobacterium xenopi 4042]
MKIGQLCILRLTSPPSTHTAVPGGFEVPGPAGPTPSRYYQNFIQS